MIKESAVAKFAVVENEMRELKNIAVIGGGLMGHGIAQVFALAGYHVTITDNNADTLLRSPARIAVNLRAMGVESDPVLTNIRLTASLPEAVAAADIVFEAASEKVELKQALFAEVARHAPPHAILASNTSVIPIELCGATLDAAAKERLVGTHWWNPPHLVPLVEVVPTPHTRADVLEATIALLLAVGKKPVKVARDVPGFIGNRLQHALWREAVHLVENGICDAETIDIVVKNSFGMRMAVLGPMENADLVGLELTRQVHDMLFPDLSCAQKASPLLDTLIAQGKSGMNSGAGLRNWTPAQSEQVRQALARHLIASINQPEREQP
jgi:3-hydroxybutyryl-CoA dehydrogenase